MTTFERDVIDRLARIEERIAASHGHDQRLSDLEGSRNKLIGMATAVATVGGLIGASISPLLAAVKALKGGA